VAKISGPFIWKIFFARARIRCFRFAKMNSTKILIIDDDVVMRQTIRYLLKPPQFEVAEAEDEESGVRLAELHNPELIMCDVNMLKGNGYSTLERLRENPATALIPFILMTGNPTEEGMRRGMIRGADDYLEKPFTGESLLATVHARLRKSELLKQQAKENEARLVATLEATPDLVAIADRNQRCVYMNRAGRKMLGINPENDIGNLRIKELVWPPALAALENEVVSALSKKEMWTGESALFNHERNEIPVSLVILANKTANGVLKFYSVIARDISERKRAEAAVRDTNKRLQMLSANLVNVQETERRHLARELHDEIGQALTAMKINLQGARQSQEPQATTNRLDECISQVDRLLQQVRNLSLDLRPPLLDDLGLVSALRWYVDQLSQRAGIHARFQPDSKMERLNSTLETACFRVAQEALTNVVRHSKAKNVIVKLALEKNVLNLSVSDDGVGFDWQAMRERSEQGASLGMVGMEERAALVGGSFSIEPISTGGSKVMVRFPISSDELSNKIK